MAPSKANNKIHFYSLHPHLQLKHRKLLKRFIMVVFKAEGITLNELRIIFCSDAYLLKINRNYLGHTDYTDVITFDLSSKSSEIEAEIYISIDRIKDNARQFRNSTTQELHRVIFHGILHLCGYADKSTFAKKQMRSKEDEYLQKYSQFVSREISST